MGDVPRLDGVADDFDDGVEVGDVGCAVFVEVEGDAGRFPVRGVWGFVDGAFARFAACRRLNPGLSGRWRKGCVGDAD